MRDRIRSISLVRNVAILAGLGLMLGAAGAAAQGLEYVKAHYTKYEYEIRMRDGVRLFTSVYVPKDASPTTKYPILMTRTPYSVTPYGIDNYRDTLGPSPAVARDGFIFVYQDVRGRMMSEGEFVDMRPVRPSKSTPQEVDETTDTWDTIDWLVKHVPGNNGKAGIWGISYPGFYAAASLIDAHPALKAVSPQAPITDWFLGDDFHHNGVLFLPHAFNFFSVFGRPRTQLTRTWDWHFDPGTADGYRFFLDMGPLQNADHKYLKGSIAFWNEVMTHENYDAFWQARNIRPHLKAIRPAVLTVGGWYDAEDLFGSLQVYKTIEKSTPGAANRLVMGPWSHGGWARTDGDALGKVRFGAKTSPFFQEQIELPFFRSVLKDGRDPGLPEAWVFETGRNQWRALDAWPPRQAEMRSVYLRAGGRLSNDPPTDEGQAFDEYLSDPAKPVPFSEDVDIGMTREYMVDDQRFAARRPDVLVYQGDVLTEDVTVAGPIEAELRVSTTGTDSDWVVKLIDVYPDDFPDPAAGKPEDDPRELPGYSKMGGYQQLVRGEPFRGRFRVSFEKPEPFVPGEVTTVRFTLPDVFHTFRRGHRLMVQVQSSWFPLANLNPQTFVSISTATEADFQKATQRVWRTKDAPSRLRLSVLPQ